MDPENQAFAKRLEEAMKAAGYEPRPSVLEREFNLRFWGQPMTLHGVRRWLRGEAFPPPKKLQVLARWLGVDPQWLRLGEAPALQAAEPAAKPTLAEPGWSERELVEALMRLPVAQRRVVREVIVAFAKAFPPANPP